MSYKDQLTIAMNKLASEPKTRFIGYGVKIGGQAAGTLKQVDPSQLIETPVAENLMASMAIGLSLKGLKPVVFIERMDFILNALDAIVNHLDKIKLMSRGEFSPAVIFRVVVGNKTKPLFTGATHTQDFSRAIGQMVNFPVIGLRHAEQVQPGYDMALTNMAGGNSTMLIEYKDLY